MKILFTVRKQYFEDIVRGVKTTEFRKANKRWITIGINAENDVHAKRLAVGTFLCGRKVHKRHITGVTLFPNAQAALGREPSEQGKSDLGDGEVIGFHLGEIVDSKVID